MIIKFLTFKQHFIYQLQYLQDSNNLCIQSNKSDAGATFVLCVDDSH
jgi:hypothetical protein